MKTRLVKIQAFNIIWELFCFRLNAFFCFMNIDIYLNITNAFIQLLRPHFSRFFAIFTPSIHISIRPARNCSNSFLFTSFFVPTYSTKLHMGFLSTSLILFMPILEYSAASLIVRLSFSQSAHWLPLSHPRYHPLLHSQCISSSRCIHASVMRSFHRVSALQMPSVTFR